MTDLYEKWASALRDLDVRHPRDGAVPTLKLIEGVPPSLQVSVREHACNVTGGSIDELPVSTVRLTFWPGITLARQWIAAAWAGYLQHEALELVTVGERTERPLDPHREPYATNPYNRGLRDGFPVELTWGSLERALAVVMDPIHARSLIVAKRSPP